MRSRTRAIVYAMGTGMTAGCGAVLAFFGYLSYNSQFDDMSGTMGAVGTVIYGLPFTLMLGLIFTGPSAFAMVFTMAAAMRREAVYGSSWLWGASGAMWSLPTVLLFLEMFNEELFELPSVHMALLALGFVCGLAGRWGYREVGKPATRPRNPSTIA